MKKLIKSILFGNKPLNRIKFGVSSGMITGYDPGSRSLHLLGLYEREIYSFLRRAMNKAHVLIDVGANDGYYGLAFLKRQNKQVILCKPGESKTDLVANLSLNGLHRDQHYRLVEDFIGSRVSPGTLTLNELVPADQPTFILIDVDGGELDIVEGFRHNSLDRIEWLIETHSLELEQGVMRCLREMGYRCEIISPAWWRLFVPEQRPLEHNRWLFATKKDK